MRKEHDNFAIWNKHMAKSCIIKAKSQILAGVLLSVTDVSSLALFGSHLDSWHRVIAWIVNIDSH